MGTTVLTTQAPVERILRMNTFKKALLVIEQAVVQNTLHQKVTYIHSARHPRCRHTCTYTCAYVFIYMDLCVYNM